MLAFLQHLPNLRLRFPIRHYVVVAGAVGVGDVVVGAVGVVGAVDVVDADADVAAAFFET